MAVSASRVWRSRSVAVIVEAASSVADAVDMIAASAAASTIPVTPTGSAASATAAKASSGESSRGTTTLAADPISAPAMPYTMQYTPAKIVPRRITFSSRPVKTRCQMSWPIIRPKKKSRK